MMRVAVTSPECGQPREWGNQVPADDKGSSSDSIKAIGAVIVTIVTAGVTIWWLALVAQRLGVKPEVNAAGAVVLDQFQRAKDLLLVVLPLFSAASAYWVGNSGSTAAKKEAETAKGKLEAVLDSSPEGILDTAKQKHPEAFSR